MEKQLKLRNRILRILPRTAAAVTMTFQNPPFTPGRDHKSRQENAAARWHNKHHHHGGKGLAGPIVPMIPDEARRKPNGENDQEPTSPKISCMGQIKSSKKKHAKKAAASDTASASKDIEVKKRVSAFQRMLLLHHHHHHHHGAKAPKSVPGRKSDASAAQGNKGALADKAPHVSQMKRFASGRDSFADFDWKAAHQAAEEIEDCYSDEGRVESDVEEEEDDVEDFRIPFSAPILLGGGEGGALNLKPRKEINLWKRRTMAPPRPLQLSV